MKEMIIETINGQILFLATHPQGYHVIGIVSYNISIIVTIFGQKHFSTFY